MTDITETQILELSAAAAVKKSYMFRLLSKANKTIAITCPSDETMFKEYPIAPVGFFATVLTFGFNNIINEQREKEFQKRDREEYLATGTTAAIRISTDKTLEKLDQQHLRAIEAQLKRSRT